MSNNEETSLHPEAGSQRAGSPQLSFRLSASFLIAANLVPLFGAIFWSWKVFDIVVLYWLENVFVGLINAIRMMLITGRNGNPSDAVGTAVAGKVFLTGFFLVHYGIFTVVHGVFVFTLLGSGSGFSGRMGALPDLFEKLNWAVLALAGSHLLSFLVNFLGRQEYQKRTLEEQMMAPYPRMLALHIAIVLGAFAVQALGQPIVLLAILVVAKTMADWKLHLRSHRKMAQ